MVSFCGKPYYCIFHADTLDRYKETRVARVVGIPRTIVTVHRDRSSIPIEIQVTEIKSADGLNFIGRIRHTAIEDRVDHDLINNLYVTIATQQNNNELLEEFVGSRTSLKGSQPLIGSKAGSKQLIDTSENQSEAEDEEDEESESSDDESESSEENAASAGVEGKLKNIKDNANEDPSAKSLALVLNVTLALLVSLLISALIASNALQTPELHFIFLDELDAQSVLLNDIIFETRLLYFSEINKAIFDNMTSTPAWENYLECSFAAPYTFTNSSGVNVTKPTCPFMKKFHPEERLLEQVHELQEVQHWFTNNYPSLREAGDQLDVTYNGPFTYREFDKGANAPASDHTASGWSDFIGSKVLDAVDKLAHNTSIHINPQSRLDFQFIQYNRLIMVDRLFVIQESVFDKFESIISKEVLAHLIIALIGIVITGVGFFVFFIPRIRHVQADRLLILKLLLLVPKSVVWDFVYTIYRDDADDEEGGEEDSFGDDKSRSGGQAAKDQAKAKALKLRSEEAVDIINDNVYGLYYFFGLGLFSVVLPLIIHLIWRYTFNTAWTEELHKYHDVTSLYTAANALLWKATGLLAPCEIREPKDYRFCAPLAANAYDVRTSADKVCNIKIGHS